MSVRFRKAVAWVLMVTTLNPALVTPAWGRDTDIYLAVTAGATNAEPNVLIVLDTSDSMNIYEGWREYQGAYDSHVEYLWNDINIISNTEVTTENASKISTAVFPASPTSPYGFWSGATLADRQALWNAARIYANGTEPGDPGARTTWRNYGNANWVYWLPAGTDESDSRLYSNSFNRWAGGARVTSFGSRNGASNPAIRGSINYGNIDDYSTPSAFRNANNARNQCMDSAFSATADPVRTDLLQGLMPSTVFAPSEFDRNSGRYLNFKWQRWERFLNLQALNVASYPGSSTSVGGYAQGYLDQYRDNVGTGPTGSQGQPVRLQQAGSNSAWTALAADNGGYVHQAIAAGLATAQLTVLRGIYGYPLLVANERFSAWKGNRDDPAVTDASGRKTGTPAYYDVSGAVSGVGSATVTKTRTCTRSGATSDGPDAYAITRQYGGTCAMPTADSDCNDQTGSCTCSSSNAAQCALVTDPAACGLAVQDQYYTRDNDSCAWTGYSTLPSRTNSGCAWTGRQSLVVEGVGTYYHGGSCRGTCTGPSCAAPVNGGENYCNKSTSGTIVVNGQTLTDYRTDNATNGCSNAANGPTYYHSLICRGRYRTPPGTPWSAWMDNNAATCSYSFTAGPLTVGSGGSAVNISNYRTDLSGCGNQADTNVTCNSRNGGGCQYSVCPANTTSSAVVGGGSYTVYNQQATDSYLVHDCQPDHTASPLMRSPAASAGWDVSYSTAATANQPYTTVAGEALDWTGVPAVDMYSVNYLNWKFGPKGPNGNPIGRKTRLQVAKDALSAIVLETNGVRFGLMVFNRTSTSIVADGANVAQRVLRMGGSTTDPDYANRRVLINSINRVVALSRTPLTESLYEAYRYISGRAPKWGTSTVAARGGGTVSQGYDPQALCSVVGPGCPAAGLYRSPMLNNPDTTTPAACQKNFVILITDGGPEDDWSANTDVKSLSWSGPSGLVSPRTSVDATLADPTPYDQLKNPSTGQPFGPTDIAGTTFDGGYIWLDELASFMARADLSPAARNLPGDTGDDTLLIGRQSVITYTIGFAGANSPALENAARSQVGSYYVAEDSYALSNALVETLNQIRDWNPTIAAPTVPLSTYTRTENANDVYLAFFQPDTSTAWKGTVKKYNLSTDPARCGAGLALCITGQTDLGAGGYRNVEKLDVDPITGQQTVVVDPTAVSLWINSASPDGGRPDRGGTGEMLINTPGYDPSNRRMYTYVTGAAGTADLTDASNRFGEANTALVTKARLGNAAMTDAQRATLVNFMLGANTGAAECSDGSTGTACTTWRSWAHFDVQHSKPMLVTYDSTTSPPVQYLFYLSNEGLLHAVDANTGREMWSFLVEEAIGQIDAIMADGAGAQIQVADGSPVSFVDDANGNGIIDSGERAWLYFGLRRGGRAYYALDISSRDAPRFKWKVTANAGGQVCTPSGCTAATAYGELGQSWSTPEVTRIRALGTGTPALVFGGGYDPAQDGAPPAAPSDTMGRALYVANGDTGQPVNWFGAGGSGALLSGASMTSSVPSDPKVVNFDFDAQGYADRIYIGDMGGGVWRFDINDPVPANWRGKLIAQLSDASGPKRKIFFAPTVARQNQPFRFDAVYVGTGDKEHPLLTSATTPATTTDKMFMVMDRDVGLTASAGSAASFAAGDFAGIADTDANVLGINPTTVLASSRGWYRELQNGEKVTGAPLIFMQLLRYGTYAPLAQANACVPAGQGRLNEINGITAGLTNVNVSDPLLATDRYYQAHVSRNFISGGQYIVTGQRLFYLFRGDGTRGLPGQLLGQAARVYWHIESEQ